MGALSETRTGVGNPQVRAARNGELFLHPTAQQAQEILIGNIGSVIGNGREHRRTVPSKDFYVHQWNWDAAATAMGLVHIDPRLAYDELRALVSGQWRNGMIPHVTYNSTEASYYPQVEKWRTERFHNGDIMTSGITQPPLFGVAVEYVYRQDPDTPEAKAFLQDILPALMNYHDHLHGFRDPEKSGLLTIIHPWESGTDNSPRWDHFHARIDLADIDQTVITDVDTNRVDHARGKSSHRPTQEHYYNFMHLVNLYGNWDWDYQKIVTESPFAVKDLIFSSIWARSNDALSNLLHDAGMVDEAQKYKRYADNTRAALAATWNDEHQQHCDIDVAQGRWESIVEPTSAMFVPLFSGAVTEVQLPRVLDRLSDPEQFWSVYPVPSVALNSEKFDPARYWRGPTWAIINYFISEGLMRYAGQSDRARRMGVELVQATLEMIDKQGFPESFNPLHSSDDGIDGRLGFGNFSWTAALFLKLASEYADLPIRRAK